MKKVGLGVVTYQRPDYFRHVMNGICKYLLEYCDTIVVVNDGSGREYEAEYQKIYATLPKSIKVIHNKKNLGVGKAKNILLHELMDAGSDYLFLSEDDVVVKDRNAIKWYIIAAERTGSHHMMYAHHGDGNILGPVASEGGIEYFGNCVGAWCFYTREAIEEVGYFDEGMYNAFEHVEHTWRIIQAGMCPPMWHFMDVWGSWRWIKEIPGSIENSTIRNNSMSKKQLKSLEVWKAKDPDNFPMEPLLLSLRKEFK